MSVHLLTYSPLDSNRFGLKVSRAVLPYLDEAALLSQIRDEQLDVAVIRLPTSVNSSFPILTEAGLHPIHADTLVYYSMDLSRHQPATIRNSDVEFSLAGPSERAELSALVETTFHDYVSHYSVNPHFDRADVLAGYCEWAEAFLEPDDRLRTWVARRNGAIVAFACCTQDLEAQSGEGVLFGVHPDHVGGGLYGDLIRHSQSQFKSEGIATMKVSTQVGNFAVQRVWVREGFHLIAAFNTFHINMPPCP